MDKKKQNPNISDNINRVIQARHSAVTRNFKSPHIAVGLIFISVSREGQCESDGGAATTAVRVR